jgi:NADH-quinone oxidoreductase subunit C
MPQLAPNTQMIQAAVQAALGAKAQRITVALNEVTLTLAPQDYVEAMNTLRHDAACQFEQLIDLCGMDYSVYADGAYDGQRYAAVSHLLSVNLNQRLRVVCFAADDDFPVVPSITSLWSAANWFEREAFDLYGIVFEGHDDLRRLLTDYGFIGHPFRKDFPVSGHVEMIYDEVAKRVVYQPVSIEPREITPRIIREETYGGLR